MRLQAPLAPRSETFEWVLPPRAGLDLDDSSLAWFIDGSLFGERFWFAKGLGFGIVVVHACGDLVACGRGRPPAWVSDAAGVELWAFFMVTKLTSWLPWTVTDCLGMLEGLRGEPNCLMGPKKRLARTWAMVVHSLDGCFLQARRKWPSGHCSHVAGQPVG